MAPRGNTKASGLLLLLQAAGIMIISGGSCRRAMHVQAAAATSASRRLHQALASSGIRAADFSSIPADPAAEAEFSVPEIQLEGTVKVLAPADPPDELESTLYGAYRIGPSQVDQLAEAISAELDLIPPSQAAKSPLVKFPGAALRGESVLDTLSAQQPRRIPTVFAPFYAGTVFRLAGRRAPPGVTLTFSNMTLLLPNVTYDGIYESGFMDFFELGRAARFCFTNSILALKSCEGYTPNIYHMWCCTARQCNILYTKQAIIDLGYEIIGNLEYIQCVASTQATDAGTPAADELPVVDVGQPTDEPMEAAGAPARKAVTGVRAADFSDLPGNLTAEVEYLVSELQLPGDISLSGSTKEPALYGTYYLGPEDVTRLVEVVSAGLALVPASEAVPTPLVEFPGASLRGESVLDTLSTQQPRRIPTVFAPFYAGTVFRVAGRRAPPGVTLNFSNMTLLLPNVTYEGIYESGFMDFFELGRSSRFCFTNSILALKSCEGYTPNTYHMWCCTKRQCNILYTQQAIEDLGYENFGHLDLEYIQCVAYTQATDAGTLAADELAVVDDGQPTDEPMEAAGAPARKAVTGVRAADFSDLPGNLTAEVEYLVSELQLPGDISLSGSTKEPALDGTYYLEPEDVTRLVKVVSEGLAVVPASEAVPTPLVEFPGASLRGESVLDTLSTQQPRRIPTVFAPFYAGTVFRLAGRRAPPGVTLTFSNMTLLLPNVTYDGIYESGFMDFFELGRSGRFCFTNSILVLKSCEGYTPNVYHMWCCTNRQCNILYTQQAIIDLGYDTRSDNLDYIQCYSPEPEDVPWPLATILQELSVSAGPPPARPAASWILLPLALLQLLQLSRR